MENGNKRTVSTTDFSEDGKKKSPPLPCWLSKFVVCLCFSSQSQAARTHHFLLRLTCCHGNADRVILWRWSLKKKSKDYIIALQSVPSRAHFIKGFLKVYFHPQTKELYTLFCLCQDPINVNLSFLCGQGQSMALGDHLLLSLLACT